MNCYFFNGIAKGSILNGTGLKRFSYHGQASLAYPCLNKQFKVISYVYYLKAKEMERFKSDKEGKFLIYLPLAKNRIQTDISAAFIYNEKKGEVKNPKGKIAYLGLHFNRGIR